MCNCYILLWLMTHNRDITCTTHKRIYMHLNLYNSKFNRYILLLVMTHNRDITGTKYNNHIIIAARISPPYTRETNLEPNTLIITSTFTHFKMFYVALFSCCLPNFWIWHFPPIYYFLITNVVWLIVHWPSDIPFD